MQQYKPRNVLSKLLPIILLIALLFAIGLLGRSLERMMTSTFLVLTPLIFGALISYIVNYKKPLDFGRTIKWLFIFCVGLLIFSIFALKEGSICVIIASPILMTCLVAGAGIMHWLCRYLWKPNKAVYSLALLPLLLMFVPEQLSTTHKSVEKSILINAPINTVWQQINHIEAIKPSEFKPSLLYAIGVPYPISGITNIVNGQKIRHSRWQKDIHFDGMIQESIPNQYLRWKYHFDADSIPKGALDDHVQLGGKYFDFQDTSYRLVPINDQQTQLILKIDYRVSTEINFYTVQVANILLTDFARVILDLYKQRSEALNPASA
ncbi:MAG: hypothetical protein EOO69_05070 [Moraxellaceae bacterium]|nr:MAG: hypothetical protein EOO69_05070 [Moraxellaceae bacterium]